MYRTRRAFSRITTSSSSSTEGTKKKMSSSSSPSSLCSSPIILEYTLIDGCPKWDHFHLTYCLTTEFPEAAKVALGNAFRRWEAVSQFTFTETHSDADLKIGFFTGKHCPGEAFDGPGGELLAHASARQFGGLHFDREKSWSFEGGINDFESVAVHELGHVLGLDHSEDESAVMYKRIRPGDIKRELTQDDIDGISALYA